MHVRLIFALVCLSFVFPAAKGQLTEYERLENKAERFFSNEEWASANAMYVLMLEQQPKNVTTYSHAVVANIMVGDTLQALDMVTRSMTYEVPLDSLLNDVRSTSFSIGRGDLYERYLLKIKDTYPWFSRVADNYLMQYYAFRQNGPELIKYAATMLEGLPENRNFMRMLAYGLMLTDKMAEAESEWLKIMSIYPNDYDTILDLANYYDVTDNRDEALKWMRRANALHKTPYVTSRISALDKQ